MNTEEQGVKFSSFVQTEWLMIEPGLELSSFWATEKLPGNIMQEHGLVPKCVS